MMLGREILQPLDLMLGTASTKDKEPPEYIQNLQESLQKVHLLARENLKTAQKREYDLNINQQVYSIGDIVLKTNSASKVGESRKLKQPWRGPYVITERVLYCTR